MSKVKGHWRTVDGKRVWVEEHTRTGLSGAGGAGATPAAVGLAGNIPQRSPQNGTVAAILQDRNTQLDQMLKQTNAKLQERRQTLTHLAPATAETIAWDTTEPAVLDALADHPAAEVRAAVGVNPHTSGATLDRMASKLTAPDGTVWEKKQNAYAEYGNLSGYRRLNCRQVRPKIAEVAHKDSVVSN